MILVKSKIKTDDNVLHIKLPEGFKNKTVEVIVRTENEIAKKLLIDTDKIDTAKWKFKREEIYGEENK